MRRTLRRTASLPVDRHDLGLGSSTVLDPGDVLDEHGLVADDLHRGITDGRDALRDGVRVDVRVEVRGDELAGGQEGVRPRGRSGDILRGHTASLSLRGIDDDIDLSLPTAVRCGARYPGDPFEQRLDVVEGVVVELRSGISGAAHDDLADRRVGRIVLEDEGREHAQRLRDGRHREAGLGLHQGLRRVQVGSPLEPDVDDAEVVARETLDVVHAWCGADILLQAPADRLLDVACRETGREGADDRDRRGELRESVDRHPRRHDAGEDNEAEAKHQDRDRVAQ